MQILLINGSPRQGSNTHAALCFLEQQLALSGIETSWFHLKPGPVQGCTGCGGCGETNRCVHDDDCNQLIRQILAADGVIAATPVYFAGANGALCALLDRVFFAAVTHGQLFQGKLAASLASCDWTGGVSALERLNRYFLAAQMRVIGSDDYLVFPRRSVLDREERALARLRSLASRFAAEAGAGSQKTD